ncbi:AraC family transcriptional regulator [Clostridium tyrobutyricum]|uniref:AraC family transcriptional regulator n=1 Tax=Clostridium tyrobutyricum TaxID=1519 RepID=UPI002B21E879|nr:AraC family transcriptional regulator [Clostridium tyrobutyricum]MEA5009162.1 AraC family transcriptional regulator [Clostridium tyrobutyricum]
MDYIDQLEKAVLFIEENICNKVTVEQVANISGYSYYHFHRIFQAITGETIGNYIRLRRLSKAASELLYTDKKVLDIAISCEFESQESFSRAFKSLYGMTPNTYRKNRIDMIFVNKKPLAIRDLKHLYQNITVKPEIINISEKRLVGIRYTAAISENPVYSMWKLFHSRYHEIINVKKNANQYSICEINKIFDEKQFDENASSNQFIGVQVDTFSKIPPNMYGKILHAGKYARFIHTGKTTDLYITYQYIWGTWIPCSGYALDMRDDFECYTENFLGIDNNNSQILIYIPIK